MTDSASERVTEVQYKNGWKEKEGKRVEEEERTSLREQSHLGSRSLMFSPSATSSKQKTPQRCPNLSRQHINDGTRF
jgi:hypothetical protein